MKKVLSLFLCVLLIIAAFPVAVLAADGGDGSTEDLPSSAIAISNVDELVMICNEYPADGYYYLTGDIDLSYDLGEYGDYYNDGKGWEPIGNSNTPFKGTFDGRGYTIKGLSINRPEQDYIGLFGFISGATIKNCKLDIVKIVGFNSVGGFAGHGYNSTFQNCKLEIGNISGYNCVGGVAGGSNGSTFENCETISGTIDTVSSDAKSSHYCGGIVGLGIDYGGYGSIKNCTNNAIIHPRAYSSTSTYYDCTGGITGYWRGGKIIGCVNNAEIAKDSYLPNSTYYGGITGWADNVVITDCTNNGAVTIPKTKYVYNAYAGGIVGYFENCVEITGCTNNAEIKIDFYRDNSYNCYAGGIIGKIQSGTNPAITKCTNTAATTVIISSIATSYAIGSTDSHAFAGGIIGYNESGATTVIDQCLNTGNISGSIEEYIKNYNTYYYGCASSGIGYGLSVIKNTVNLGTSRYLSFGEADTIENCYNFSNENTVASVIQGTTKNCYSISSFTAENGTVWLSDGSAVTRTNKQMRLKSTFEGFDFENTWTMEGNPDFPYPELISNPSSFKKSLASISVAALPDKVNYLEGKDEFDITGALLRLTYDNGTTEKIPMTAEMVSGFDNTIVGTNRIKVQYGGFETSFNVTVIARSLVSIAVSKMPTKTEYLEGKDEFSPSGGELTLTYNNGTSKTVDMKDAAFTGFDNSTPGVQTVTVSYGGKTTTLKVTVIEKTLEKIELTTLPSKTQYLEGKDKLQKDGGVITLYYNNGKTATVSLNDADVTGFNNRVVGTQTLTVHYMEKTAQFEVKIIAKSVSRISVASVPDVVTYLEGKDELSADGGKITVYYNNDTEDEIFMDASMLSGFDCDTVGMQTITVTYGGKTAFFEVEVIAKTLEKIELLSAPAKKTYREKKDTLNLSGARINLIYNNGTTAPLEITDEMVSGFDNSVIGKQTITVTYMGKTTTFEVEIIAKTAMSISITQKPDKLTYLEGKDELDVTGGVITVYYDNDSTSTMVMTPDMITGFDNSNPGTQTLTVTYLGKTATFDVVIKAKSLVGFELVKNPVKTVYKEGEALTLEGIVGRFTYDNGAVVDLPVSTAFASGFNNRKVGKQTVTITIDTYVDSFEVTVEHNYRETVVPPTCIKKGYTEFTCSVCGYSYKDKYTDKAPHDTVSHPGKAAKCTEKGYKDYVTCKNCDYTTFEETPVLGHDTETLGAVAATCTKTGLTEGKRCKRCGEILVKQNVIAKAPHKWDGGKVTKQPLVGVAGERTYTCTVCKTTRTETIAPLPPQNIEVKTTDIGKMLADGIVGALPGVNAGALLKTSNASYITDKNGKRLADKIPLATGMRIVLESGSTKLQKDICILGDVDCDGAVTVNDARAALRAAVKLDILKGASLDAARVLGNSTVTVDDARAILRVVVKLDPAKDWLKKVK